MTNQLHEAEYDVIGNIFYGNNGAPEKILLINSDNFSKVEHKEIFKALKALYRGDEALDVFKVTSKLKESCNPKLLDSCLNVLARIPVEKDRFELQSSKKLKWTGLSRPFFINI